METIVITGVIISSIIYLYIGFVQNKYQKSLGDIFPIVFGRTASVNTTNEFTTSTVATTVSLATIILAYFELAGFFGLYLLWTAATTAIGMVLVSVAAKRIWQKMSEYDHRPSMHEFLGREYNSPKVALIASACTSIGFLLIFATELIVGSRFLAGLVPQIPEWASVVFLCLVGFLYTVLGGFRAVIKTDQLQMKFIWGLIAGFIVYYIYFIIDTSNFSMRFSQVPAGIFDFSFRPGLISFLVGITIMNIPTHISNMSIWQRISGAQKSEVVEQGIRNSIWSLILSWGLLVLIACFAYVVVSPESPQTLLTDLLNVVSNSVFGKIVLFFVVLGFFGAMLSTASTNLIVVAHTVSEDIIAKFKKAPLKDRVNSTKELRTSRIILFASSLIAIFLVEGLKYFGFSIADLVFAIYGGALTLFPPIIIALYSTRERLSRLSNFCTWAVILGFVAGWGSAIYGKIIGDSNLIFLSPCFSIFTSLLIMGIGYLFHKQYHSDDTK